MKQVILGDTHGRTMWKQILQLEHDFDRVIFIGDYVDTHESITPLEQVENLRDIIHFKQAQDALGKKEVVLLLGNHDFQYWPSIDEHYSGYQPMMRPTFEYEYRKYQHLFKIAFSDERGYLYTHAGVTNTFLRSLGITEVSVSEIVTKLNNKFKHQPYKFGYFDGDFSGYGEDVRQSCIWVRPQSLYKDRFDILQFIGHTTVTKINHPPKSERRGFYLIDALGTSREYIVIVDGEVTIKQLPK